MLFRKKMPRSCTYCAHGTKLNDVEILCIKNGIVSINKACHKFCYDPCKRVPPKPKASDFKEFSKKDFSL